MSRAMGEAECKLAVCMTCTVVGGLCICELPGRQLEKENTLTGREKIHWLLWKVKISQCLVPLWDCTNNGRCSQQQAQQHLIVTLKQISSLLFFGI